MFKWHTPKPLPSKAQWWKAMVELHRANPSYRLPQIPILGDRRW